MQAIDLAIVGLYVLATIVIGLVARRRAARSLQSYYLADKSMPWYLLGLSNASDMYDVTGTMWLVTLCVVYGLKCIWIPWLWPVFNQIFLMVYLSCWLRRSNALTGAEWIETRFGQGRGGQLSQFVVIGFAVSSVLGFLAYGFVGIGKFIEIFLPWSTVAPYVPFEVAPKNVANFYGITFTTLTMIYAVLGGMFSIVWTDVLKFILMTVVSVIVAVIAIQRVDPATIAALTPTGWHTPFFGWSLDLEWSGGLAALNHKITSDGFSLFGAFMMMLLFKGVLVSAAGPAPNYDMQKILSTRSPREAALMSGFVSIVLMPIRYLLVAGFAVLAIAYFDDLGIATADTGDYDRILPAAMRQFAPPGVLGLIVAGLLAAFVSTFAATLNAAPAYLVNDVYRRYINPQASRQRLIYLSYAVFDRVRVPERRDRSLHPKHQFTAHLDRFGTLGRIHGCQRPQVVLVALQRLRLLRRHACGDDRRARPAPLSRSGVSADRRGCFPALQLSAAAAAVACRLPDRYVPDAARRHGHAEAVLPEGSGPGVSGGRCATRCSPRNRNSRSTAISAGTHSTSSSVRRCRQPSSHCLSTSCCAASMASRSPSRSSPWAARS